MKLDFAGCLFVGCEFHRQTKLCAHANALASLGSWASGSALKPPVSQGPEMKLRQVKDRQKTLNLSEKEACRGESLKPSVGEAESWQLS